MSRRFKDLSDLHVEAVDSGQPQMVGKLLEALVWKAQRPVLTNKARRSGQNDLDDILPTKSLREIVEEAEQVPEWIVHDLMKRGELSLLDGLAKLSGKTTFIMHALKAVRRGEMFLGRDTRSERVLYLSEQGNSFRQAIEDAGLDLDDDGFRVVQFRDVSDVGWEDLIDRAIRLCEAENRSVLVRGRPPSPSRPASKRRDPWTRAAGTAPNL